MNELWTNLSKIWKFIIIKINYSFDPAWPCRYHIALNFHRPKFSRICRYVKFHGNFLANTMLSHQSLKQCKISWKFHSIHKISKNFALYGNSCGKNSNYSEESSASTVYAANLDHTNMETFCDITMSTNIDYYLSANEDIDPTSVGSSKLFCLT